MALQGDLNSFALPDVLRLLAGTAKSGRLEVAADTGTGQVVLSGGSIATATVSTAPHATTASDVVFEILRFGGGSFVFEEGDHPVDGDLTDVESAIADAEDLATEWAAVEAVVPSMDAWVSLLPEIEDDAVTISADHWRALVAIAGGGNVHDLADALELTELAASRVVKELVEASLATVRASHGYQPPEVQLDSFEEFELAVQPTMTDLEDLGAEDRPVVMEDRDDALLPEPLPGEGVAYDGESIVGVVDGRSSEAPESRDHATGTDSDAPFGSADPDFSLALAAAEAPGIDDSPAIPDDAAAFAEVTSAAALDAVPSDDSADGSDAPVEADDERGSLLRFLSTVKP